MIIGPSGGGKSQLALALMGEASCPAELVADDRVVIRTSNNMAIASAPAALEGKIERFGMGIETYASRASATIKLVVELIPREKMERMPDPQNLVWKHKSVSVPKLILPTQPVNPVSSIRATLRRA